MTTAPTALHYMYALRCVCLFMLFIMSGLGSSICRRAVLRQRRRRCMGCYRDPTRLVPTTHTTTNYRNCANASARVRGCALRARMRVNRRLRKRYDAIFLAGTTAELRHQVARRRKTGKSTTREWSAHSSSRRPNVICLSSCQDVTAYYSFDLAT